MRKKIKTAGRLLAKVNWPTVLYVALTIMQIVVALHEIIALSPRKSKPGDVPELPGSVLHSLVALWAQPA